MKYRKLRIAWSIVWGTATLLLIALWVRSYWTLDQLTVPPSLVVSSMNGKFWTRYQFPSPSWCLETFSSHRAEVAGYPPANIHDLIPVRKFDHVSIPYWFPILGFAVSGVAPWTLNRFGLRTLLTAVTLVAVALGLIGWAAD